MRLDLLVKIKMFDGVSFMDLIASKDVSVEHIQLLINEAEEMDAAYERSGLARSKAPPTDDWRSYISLPGSCEG